MRASQLCLALSLGCARTSATTAECAKANQQCYHNQAGHYATQKLVDPGACCLACQADDRCESFTHWHDETGWVCFLFRTTTSLSAGNCPSGTASGHAPAP